MEGRPMVCYSTGAINSLVHKLEITQLKNNHPMIECLLRRLEILRKDHVNKLAGRRATGEQVKVWMKQVREMVYDIEDWIDLRQEAAANFSEWDMRQIDEFMDQTKEALGRCQRYELLDQAPASDAEPVYHAGASDVAGRGLLLREEKTVLVGISTPKSDLKNHLEKEQKELKVVSIVGAGGHGKTALAREIYAEMKAQFECQAFVSVGRTASTKTTLIEILRQVKSEADDRRQARSCNEEQVNEVITELWGFLRNKRYFICIDDIRSTRDSEVINCALPDNHLGSRILTTTRIKDIARSCSRRPKDVVYEMIALGEDDSKSLLLNSAYVPEEEWPDHFKESSKKMLKVCGGVPLAIIITAGLLGRTSAELSVQSKMINETILSEFIQSYSPSQAMRTILDISYGDLHLPLKSCFLYMSAFSGNDRINKGRLIRRWVAEGLIPETPGKSSWETGESYFDELISRRLIQPVFDDNDDQPTGCTVHGTVVDFMESLSTKGNFITAGAELKSGLFPCDRVRRVSLDCSDDEDEGDDLFSNNTFCPLEQKSSVASSSEESSSSDKDEAISLHLSRVRSLAFSGDARMIPDLSAFRYVRVLDLEDTNGLENKQLESIGCLSLLRYLGLGNTDVTELPEQVMELEHLSALDLRGSKVRKLPAFRDTRKLISLLADDLTIRRGMGGIQEMEELSKVLLGHDSSPAEDVAELVNKLRRLRMLGIKFGHMNTANKTDRQGVKHFLEEVGKSNLQFLFLDDYPHCLLDLLLACWTPERPHYLRKFELRMSWFLWSSKVPQEIASLVALTHLHIGVIEVEAQGVRALGNLPSLVLLKLYSHSSPRFIVSSKDGFQCLKVFWYACQCSGGMGLQFKAGAMPQLRRLRLDFNVRETMSKYGNLNFGIQHLESLVQVRVTIDCRDVSTASEVEDAEAQIRSQASHNPKNPILELSKRGHDHLKATAAPAEGSVIKIHSLPQWSKQIDEANSTDPKKLVVIDFSASWCGPSRMMAPIFRNLARKFPDVVFLKVDVDEMEIIAQQFSVKGVPTFLFMKGGRVRDRVVGARKEKLLEKLERQMADVMVK